MEQVGVREIRQNISVFLRRVQAGETFTVTDHGSPVALLIPVPAHSDDRLADLVAAGHVLPAANRRGVLPAPAKAPADRPSATEALLAERRADER
jgi:prevent-host-death family protein